MNKSKVLILAAAVMFVAATSAYGYHEQWSNMFCEGTLTCGGYNYTRNATGGTVDDTSGASYDYFYHNGSSINVAFVCSALNDTIYLALDTVSGTKQTGQSGTKEGSGTWAGSAVRRKNTVEQTWNRITGTWDTNENDENFDYTPLPSNPTYHAGWDIYPTVTLSGGGSSTGERTHSD